MKNTKNNEVKNEVESKSERMLVCLKAMARNEKTIARLQKRIQSIEKCNIEISNKFKAIIDEK